MTSGVVAPRPRTVVVVADLESVRHAIVAEIAKPGIRIVTCSLADLPALVRAVRIGAIVAVGERGGTFSRSVRAAIVDARIPARFIAFASTVKEAVAAVVRVGDAE